MDTQIQTFLNYLYQIIDKIHNENKYCILMGDFNINLLNFESHPITEQFINTLSTNFFHPQILKPTRITNHSATLIDNIFFNSAEHHTISGNILHDGTDHMPNFLVINKFCTLPSNIKVLRRDYSNYDQTTMLDEVKSVNWNNILPETNDVIDIFLLLSHRNNQHNRQTYSC